MVHLLFFQTHLVFFLVLLVITHFWPEIKHQEYANIYTQITPVSGCSLLRDPQLCHWANPYFTEKMGKENPQATKKDFAGSAVLFQESIHTSQYSSLTGLWKRLTDFKKEMGRLFKNMLPINPNFLMLTASGRIPPPSKSEQPASPCHLEPCLPALQSCQFRQKQRYLGPGSLLVQGI